MRIFLDLDGVISNFVKGVFDWFGIAYDKSKVTNWNALEGITGLSGNDFWERIKYRNFWKRLEFTPEAKEILKVFDNNKLKPCILTSPAQGTCTWKEQWIKNNLSEYYKSKRFIFANVKSWCAYSDSVLIDDANHNIEQFEEAGGNGILFPQPWNKMHYIDQIDQKIKWLEWSLKEFKIIN